MSKKNDYFDADGIDVMRQKQRKVKKKRKTGKVFLTIIGMAAVAIAVFCITVKVCMPDFDFATLVPENVKNVFSDLAGNTTAPSETVSQTAAVTQGTTEPKPQEISYYLPYEEFEFKTSVQGNHIGNLLNGGKVATDMTYIYHISDSRGIYRFEPSGETYAVSFSSDDDLSCLNLRGDYFYYVNNDDEKLYRLSKGGKSPESIADDVKFAYVYDKTIYYITNDNAFCIMGTDGKNAKELYSSPDKEMNFVGISLKRVFFTLSDNEENVQYYTVDNNASEDAQKFMTDTSFGEMINLQLENGFFYYDKLQDDGTYDLCRKKIGSKNEVTLVENDTAAEYAVIDSNKLFYSSLNDGKYKMRELNMNSKDEKTLLSVNSVESDNTLHFYHGGEYDFIIGEKSSGGKKVYIASSMYTGSYDVMSFDKGKWSY